MVVKKWVTINTQFEGFHHWGDAPDLVAFLRNSHRHIFYVKVYMTVEDEDRDIEIILAKRYIDKKLSAMKNMIDTEGWSCERIARELAEDLLASYDSSEIQVQVLEDNENGGGYHVCR